MARIKADAELRRTLERERLEAEQRRREQISKEKDEVRWVANLTQIFTRPGGEVTARGAIEDGRHSDAGDLTEVAA